MKLPVRSIVLIALFLAASVHADVKLPNVIGGNMVLQRDQPLPIWGWASIGEQVTVSLGDNTATTKTGEDGTWMVKLKPMKADGGKNHTLIVKGNNEIKLANILIGEVWICSGQSNMEWGVQSTMDAQKEIAAANYPNIRLFQVPKTPAGLPQKDVNAAWQPCTPKTVPGFSAVAYFFGRHLQKELDVPIGLLHPSWGGTRIEPWTPIEGFRAVPGQEKNADRTEQIKKNYVKATADSVSRYRAWLAVAEAAAAAGKEVPAPPAWPAIPAGNAGAPTELYNGMVAPLVPFAIRGAIWYQGESNRGEGMGYLERSKALIQGWRNVWNQEANKDFPFLIVQLAPYNYGSAPTALPEIWEAQTACLTAIPNTGMAVTTDIGNPRDIHPNNKQDVGKRLALWALAKTYGKDIVYSGPLVKDVKFEGGKAIISFNHVGGGLVSRDGKDLSHFQLAGEDKAFAAAKAEIVGDTVVVTSETVAKPAFVRFGWDHVAEPNLSNKDGLPASPFRTDK